MLRVDDITVRFNSISDPVLDGFSLDVDDRETVALLGPSGCGKTTVLRAVAGLQSIEHGTIALDGQDMAGVPTHCRGLGFMFQDHALFPHLRVAENVEFGLRMNGVEPDVRRARTHEVLDLVGLSGHGDRSIDSLSGGERQRVALARAIAPAPRLLMLDEPLGSLDRTLRDRLVLELQEIFTELGLSVLYVTHDQSEAMALADRMVVMDKGRVIQEGTPVTLWSQPVNSFVARFLGLTNVVRANVEDGFATTPWGLNTPCGGPDGEIDIVIRPGAISLASGPATSAVEGIPVTVIGHIFAGDHTRLKITVDSIRADSIGKGRYPDPRVSPGSQDRIELEATVPGGEPPPDIGTRVTVWIDPRGVVRLQG